MPPRQARGQPLHPIYALYELDLGEPTSSHPALGRFAQAERGGTFFVDPRLLAKLAAAPTEEVHQRLSEAAGFLAALRKAVEEGRSAVEAERTYLDADPGFARWTRIL